MIGFYITALGGVVSVLLLLRLLHGLLYGVVLQCAQRVQRVHWVGGLFVAHEPEGCRW